MVIRRRSGTDSRLSFSRSLTRTFTASRSCRHVPRHQRRDSRCGAEVSRRVLAAAAAAAPITRRQPQEHQVHRSNHHRQQQQQQRNDRHTSGARDHQQTGWRVTDSHVRLFRFAESLSPLTHSLTATRAASSITSACLLATLLPRDQRGNARVAPRIAILASALLRSWPPDV